MGRLVEPRRPLQKVAGDLGGAGNHGVNEPVTPGRVDELLDEAIDGGVLQFDGDPGPKDQVHETVVRGGAGRRLWTKLGQGRGGVGSDQGDTRPHGCARVAGNWRRPRPPRSGHPRPPAGALELVNPGQKDRRSTGQYDTGDADLGQGGIEVPPCQEDLGLVQMGEKFKPGPAALGNGDGGVGELGGVVELPAFDGHPGLRPPVLIAITWRSSPARAASAAIVSTSVPATVNVARVRQGDGTNPCHLDALHVRPGVAERPELASTPRSRASRRGIGNRHSQLIDPTVVGIQSGRGCPGGAGALDRGIGFAHQCVPQGAQRVQARPQHRIGLDAGARLLEQIDVLNPPGHIAPKQELHRQSQDQFGTSLRHCRLETGQAEVFLRDRVGKEIG